MDRTLGITPEELKEVGNQMKSVAAEVGMIFDKVTGIVNQVTANDSWKSEASDLFLEKFETLKVDIDADLRRLDNVGPTLMGAADDYEGAEADNASQINKIERV